MENSLETIIASSIAYVLIFFAVLIVIYILFGIFLNKLNKLVYGKGTPMAFIPFVNIYLLGKLAVNKLVGYILVILVILNSEFSITINNETSAAAILPEDIRNVVSIIYSVLVLGLFIYAIVKYFKLKKANTSSNTKEEDNSKTEE